MAQQLAQQLRGRTPHASWRETGLQPGDKVKFAGEIPMNVGYMQHGTVPFGQEAHRQVQVLWERGTFDPAIAPSWAGAPPSTALPDEHSVPVDDCWCSPGHRGAY